MKRVLLSAFVVVLFLGSLSHTRAHQGDRLYPIFELSDADLAVIDLHDGSVGEWEDLLGEAAITALDFEASRNFDPYDPRDMDFRIWLAWHDATNRIYVAMERADDIYINEYDPREMVGSHRFMEGSDSSLMFEVDGDHSGGRFRGFNGREDLDQILQVMDREAQQYIGIGETLGDYSQVILNGLTTLLPTNAPLVDWSNLTHWFNQPPYAEGGGGRFGEQPILTVTEFYITPYDLLVWDRPEESRVSPLSAGQVIGFSMAVIDIDEPYRRDIASTKSFLLLPIRRSSSADSFVDGILLGPGGEMPDEDLSAVESETWGRIKATFIDRSAEAAVE